MNYLGPTPPPGFLMTFMYKVSTHSFATGGRLNGARGFEKRLVLTELLNQLFGMAYSN